jgi:HTH-type transcriptional regulator/antitoxin HigA
MDYKTPGQLLTALLAEKGWTQRVLAIVLNMDETVLSNHVNDQRAIDAPLALALEEVFHVRAETFLELQRNLDLAVARVTVRPDPGRATRARLYGDLPVAEMIKRGWIVADSVRDTAAVEPELLRFFGANRVEDIEFFAHAAKKTEVNEPASPAQLAWLYRVRAIATEMLVGRYSPAALQAALPKLKALLEAPEEARKVPRILAEAGVRFIIVETLHSAKIDGVCFWLDAKSPVIALTTRFDRMDNFWFVLRHEIEHVLQEHGQRQATVMLDAELEGDRAGTGTGVAEEERIANAAAAEFCVPRKKMDAFISAKAPFFHERDVIALSRMVHVHPALVAGQLRFRTGLYNRFADLIVKIRSHVAPSAMVDGWGDVIPLETGLKGIPRS